MVSSTDIKDGDFIECVEGPSSVEVALLMLSEDPRWHSWAGLGWGSLTLSEMLSCCHGVGRLG